MASRTPATRTIPVALPADESPRAGWLRGFRVSGFAVTVLFLLVAALVMLAPSLRTLVDQQQQIAQLRDSVAEAKRQKAELTQQVARWSDPAYLKAQARDRLLYAFPGDVTFLILNDVPQHAASGDGLPISDRIQSSKVDWVHGLASSFVTAGLSQQPADRIASPEQSGASSSSR